MHDEVGLCTSLGVSFRKIGLTLFTKKSQKTCELIDFRNHESEKLYFDMNGSIVIESCFHHTHMYYDFLLEVLSQLLNNFKVTHIYYKNKF